MPIEPDTVKEILAALRGYEVPSERAAELAREVARANDAARADGARNDFNAQPTDFAVMLEESAHK